MSKFYTNVSIRGNKILLRGYEDGRRVHTDIPYQPFCFQRSSNPNAPYKTIDGYPADRKDFESINDMMDYMKLYDGVEGMKLYGMTSKSSLIYPFIHEYYPGEIQYDASLMNIVHLDIEVAADEGFPNIDEARIHSRRVHRGLPLR